MPFDFLPFTWIFPLAYVVHIAEEHWCGGGFCGYLGRSKGVRLTPLRFLTLTGLGCALMVLGILLAEPLDFRRSLLIIFGTVLLTNGLAHARTGARERLYHPGLVSGALLWTPLGAATLFTSLWTVSADAYVPALAVGLGIQMVVSRLAVGGGKLA